jgi:hypothetical protein
MDVVTAGGLALDVLQAGPKPWDDEVEAEVLDLL